MKKKIRLTFVVLAVFLSMFALVTLVYLSLSYDKYTKQMTTAKEMLDAGNKTKAFEILRELAHSDPSNEEAFRMLVKICEEKKDYHLAAYFLSNVVALNALDKTALLDYYNALIISRTDEVLLARYNQRFDKSVFSDEIKYNIGIAFLRKKLITEAKKIKSELKNKAYVDLLNATNALSINNIIQAKIYYSDALKSPEEDIKNYANLGLSICALQENNPTLAKSKIEEIKNPSKLLNGDLLIVKGNIELLLGNAKEALKILEEASILQRQNALILLQTAELAYELSDTKVIDNLIELINAENKETLSFIYYLKSLKFAISKDWTDYEQNINMSGIFTKRKLVSLLNLEASVALKDVDKIISSIETLSPNALSNQTRQLVVLEILPLLNSNQINLLLCDAILKLSPENPQANFLKMRFLFERRQYAEALACAENILKNYPNNKDAYNVAIISLIDLKRFNQAHKLSQKSVVEFPQDSQIHLIAARAADLSSNIIDAKKNYIKALELSKNSTQIAEEAGIFFVKNKDTKELEKLTQILTADQSNRMRKALGFALKSRQMTQENNILKAQQYLQEAINCAPEVPNAYLELGALQWNSGQKKEATQTFKNGVEKTGQLEYEYANLLLSSQDVSDFHQAFLIARKLSRENPNNAQIQVLLSKSCFQTGDINAALSAARKAYQISPTDQNAQINLAEVLIKMEQFENASAILEKSFELSGGDKRVSKLLKLTLESLLKSTNNDAEKKKLQKKISEIK